MAPDFQFKSFFENLERENEGKYQLNVAITCIEMTETRPGRNGAAVVIIGAGISGRLSQPLETARG